MRVREKPRGMGTGGMTSSSSDSIPDTATTPEKNSCRGEGESKGLGGGDGANYSASGSVRKWRMKIGESEGERLRQTEVHCHLSVKDDTVN